MKKYNNKSNVIGSIIKEKREQMGLTKAEVCRRVELHGVYIDRVELYRMEAQIGIIKDFELIALCDVLNIDYKTEVKTLIE